MFTPSRCENIRIRKFDFVAKTQCLLSDVRLQSTNMQIQISRYRKQKQLLLSQCFNILNCFQSNTSIILYIFRLLKKLLFCKDHIRNCKIVILFIETDEFLSYNKYCKTDFYYKKFFSEKKFFFKFDLDLLSELNK